MAQFPNRQGSGEHLGGRTDLWPWQAVLVLNIQSVMYRDAALTGTYNTMSFADWSCVEVCTCPRHPGSIPHLKP